MAVCRDYVLDVNCEEGQAPLLSILGGKITTYRKLAEQALLRLKPWLKGLKAPWTAHEPLPGGDIINADLENFIVDITRQYDWLPITIVKRYATSYGTYINNLLQGITCIAQMGQYFGHGLYQREVEYLIENEWAYTVEDILWRRTKLGLYFSEIEIQQLEHFIAKLCTSVAAFTTPASARIC